MNTPLPWRSVTKFSLVILRSKHELGAKLAGLKIANRIQDRCLVLEYVGLR